MLEKTGIIFLSKNTDGDLILEIKPDNFNIRRILKNIIKLILSLLIKITFPIFSFFDFLASKKKLVISSVGLGIGFGLSVIITQRPDALQAFPSIATQGALEIRVQKLVISDIDLFGRVQTGSVQNLLENMNTDYLIHDDRSADLGSNSPVVITEVGVSNILENLEKVQIGDILEITGNNNAIYRYSVTEIRDMQSEYLTNVVGYYQEAVILYKAKNLIRTQLYIVIATPF